MKDYDVSQNGLDGYQSEVDEEEELKELDEMEESEYLEENEPEDEETFRARNEAYSKQIEEKTRPFVSWILSKSCQNISESIDNLEKLILKKPFYGTKLKMDRNSAKKSLNNVVANTSYERKRSDWIDCLLSKNKFFYLIPTTSYPPSQ